MPKGSKANIAKAQKKFGKKDSAAKKQVAKEQRKHGKKGTGSF